MQRRWRRWFGQSEGAMPVTRLRTKDLTSAIRSTLAPSRPVIIRAAHSLTHSLTHSLNQSLTHSLTPHSLPLTSPHSLTHSLTHFVSASRLQAGLDVDGCRGGFEVGYEHGCGVDSARHKRCVTLHARCIGRYHTNTTVRTRGDCECAFSLRVLVCHIRTRHI